MPAERAKTATPARIVFAQCFSILESSHNFQRTDGVHPINSFPLGRRTFIS